jgi:hypothetical protein
MDLRAAMQLSPSTRCKWPGRLEAGEVVIEWCALAQLDDEYVLSQ